jgi:hypothetical protein
MKDTVRFLILALAIGFSSCSSYFYYPTSQNVLRFKDKGDVNVAFGLDEHGYKSYNLGYSLTDNVALISDFKTFHTYSSESDMRYKIGDFYWDNELIIYKNYQDRIFPAINFGYGFGQINRNEDYYRLGVDRQFIQPSIGFSNNYFDFAVSSRFSRVHYDLKQTRSFNLSNRQSFEEYFDLRDVGKKDFYFLEPSLTLGVGYKFAKLRFQSIYVNKISSGNLRYIESNNYLTLNCTFNINKLLMKGNK